MSILSKIFGNKSTQNNTVMNEPVQTQTMEDNFNLPEQDLFIDMEPPVEATQKIANKQNAIQSFLAQDFYSMGVKDGFEHHNFEALDLGKYQLKAQFRNILDEVRGNLKNKRLELVNAISEVTAISDILTQKLENKMRELKLNLMTLEKQKELTVEDEGWVMNAIHLYEKGFTKGVKDYLEGEAFLINTSIL